MKWFACMFALLTVLSSGTVMAQNETASRPFDVVIKGNGVVTGENKAGRFEFNIMKANNLISGKLKYVENSTSATKNVVVLTKVKDLIIDGKTARFSGEGLFNEKPALIKVAASDFVTPGSPLTVLDNLVITVSTSAGIVYKIAGFVNPGDIALIYPPDVVNRVHGTGAIKVNETTVGLLNVDVKALKYPNQNALVFDGRFRYTETDNTSDRPSVVIETKKILSLAANGREAVVRAEVVYLGEPALGILTVIDNRKPTDATDLPSDAFSIQIIKNETVVYQARGPIFRGDLIVKSVVTITHQVIGEGLINISNTTKGLLNIDVKEVTTINDTLKLMGKFRFVEQSISASPLPTAVVESTELISLVVNGKEAVVRSKCIYNRQNAVCVITIVDNRRPTDPTTTPMDIYSIRVYIDSVEVYSARGVVIRGDFLVR